MRARILFVALAALGCCAGTVAAETYGLAKARQTRQLAIERHYDIPVRKGKKAVAAIPAMMSFWGSTHEQVIRKSELSYSIQPDQVRVTADDRGMPRRNYELTWNAPDTNTISVTQTMLVDITIRNRLYTQARVPYAPAILQRYASSLGNGEDINIDNPKVEAIGKQILKKTRLGEAVVEEVCDWINENIKFELNTPQNSDGVLQGGKASCGGMSHLACAILRKIGIPAEFVAGKFINGTIGHGYMEVYFPDAGWVFYDLSNHERGFKTHDVLMTAGYSYRVGNGQSYKWHTGYFCDEKDVAAFSDKYDRTARPIRPGPKGEECLGVAVTHRRPSSNVPVRHLSLRELIMDLSVPPGPRPYKSMPQVAVEEEPAADETPPATDAEESASPAPAESPSSTPAGGSQTP
ncbi:MAG: hypothetical protein JXL80_00970 [Planctomycetes bacterium]|nr:hypothetical protein [Planctomycetota bacterium]